MEQEIQYGEAGERSDLTEIQMPAPTLWPLALALGVMLLRWGKKAIGCGFRRGFTLTRRGFWAG